MSENCWISPSVPVLRYRHWKLGEDIDLIVRCEHDGVMTGANGEVSFINVKTLNEWDSRVRASFLGCFPFYSPAFILKTEPHCGLEMFRCDLIGFSSLV